MTSEGLPESVLHFIEACIDSIEQLRVLLLLHADPTRIWTTSEITAELRSADSSIDKRLSDLYSRKVLLRLANLNGRHIFSPSNDDIRIAVDELAEQNRLRPYRVIEEIYTQRTRALLEFANAFKLRGGKL